MLIPIDSKEPPSNALCMDISTSYLVYSGGESFQTALVFGIDAAFDAAVRMIFHEMPDPDSEPEMFDEFVTFKNDFENQSFWREEGAVWETDCKNGYVVIVRIEGRLN